MANMDFTELLEKVQTHLSRRYAAALSDKEKYNQLKPYITTFLRENGYSVEGISLTELVDEMASPTQ